MEQHEASRTAAAAARASDELRDLPQPAQRRDANNPGGAGGGARGGASLLPPCPVATFDLASTAHGADLVALFVNRAPHPVRVLHVDATGREVPTLALRAGEHAEVRGKASYAWRARAHSGALLLELARTPAPPDGAGGVTTIHVSPCE